MKLTYTIGAAILMTCGSAVFAGPVIDLAPGDNTSGLSGIRNTDMSELIGSIESDILQDFTIYANSGGIDGPEILYEGTLMTRVARSFETGRIHFNYRILNPNAQLLGAISNVEVTGYQGFQTRVEYRDELTSPGFDGPEAATRSANGDILNFDFGQLLDTAEDSRYFFAMIDSENWYADAALATIYLQSGESVTLSVAGANPVPAPGALGLLSAAGLMTIRRRR
ncbi:MAG: hypothetical protein JKX70_07615 [Phycisphaerales bacterium]|nr:hypothetical protein [Phycisphaerales bacterium]